MAQSFLQLSCRHCIRHWAEACRETTLRQVRDDYFINHTGKPPLPQLPPSTPDSALNPYCRLLPRPPQLRLPPL